MCNGYILFSLGFEFQRSICYSIIELRELQKQTKMCCFSSPVYLIIYLIKVAHCFFLGPKKT